MDSIAAHSGGYSPRCSCTMRTARSRTSGEYLGVVFLLFMAPFSQGKEPPQNPGRFISGVVVGHGRASIVFLSTKLISLMPTNFRYFIALLRVIFSNPSPIQLTG